MKGKQTFTCILEIECSFQMTFHLPVNGRRGFFLYFFPASISKEISLSSEDVLTSAAV